MLDRSEFLQEGSALRSSDSRSADGNYFRALQDLSVDTRTRRKIGFPLSGALVKREQIQMLPEVHLPSQDKYMVFIYKFYF